MKVGAKVDGAVAGLRKVKAGVDDLTKADLQKPSKAFDSIANKSALMGGAILLGVGKAVSSFADFDQAMSAVAANSGATGDALNSLRDTAMKLGADTQFSATEAAQGINELAKAGVSAQDILGGGIKGALDLAAAGQIGVAQAAETTASALNQFGQDGSQATHVADLLANAANAAQGGVGDMGMALNQAGVAANAAGLNIDETTTLLALFAKAGMTGSDAGTSLKTMMQRLAAPTDKAAATLKDLGVSAYDAQGNFVGAQALLGQLSDATKDMSTQARAAAFNVIFGTDAIRAASIAAAAGADGYAKMNAEVTKVGGAADNAAKLTDNLKGDLERLSGALDTAFIQTGSAANGGLRTLVQGLEGAVDVVGRLPGPLVLAATGLAGIALTLPKGISIYREFAGQLDTLGLSLDKISAKAPRAAKALRGLQAAGTLVALGSVSASIQETSAAAEVAEVNVDKLAESLTGLTKSGPLQGGIADLFRHEGGLLNGREEFVSTADAIERFNATAYDALSDNNFAKLLRVMQPGAEDKFDKYVTQIDAALAQLVGSGHADQAKASIDALLAGIDDPQVREAAQKSFPQYADALKNAGNSAEVAGGQMDGMSEDVAAVQQKADDAKKALDDLKTTLEGFGSPLAEQRAAQRDYKDSVDAARQSLKDQRDEIAKTRLGGKNRDQIVSDRLASKGIKSATPAQRKAAEQFADNQIKAAEKYADAQIKGGAALDLNSQAGRKNQATLDAIRDKALQAASTTFNLTRSQELAAAEVQKGRDDFINQAIALGKSADEAKALADNMGLIPKDVAIAISLSGVDTVNAQFDAITGKVTVLDKTTAKPAVKPYLDKSSADATEARIDQLARQRDVFIQIGAGLSSAASSLFSGIEGIGGTLFPKKRAAGGPIFGPGTGTSDTAGVFALSNNEHVLTAREVAAAGGHGAIFALRKAILAGGVQFRAAGGPSSVTAYRAAPSVLSGGYRGPSASEIAAAMASQMPPQVSVYSGADARSAARDAIRDWEWGQVQ